MEIIPEPALTPELIADRYDRLSKRLREAAESGGHDPDKLRVVAVTKAWPIEVCRAALDAGLRMLGENRVQEAEPKVAALPDAEWHLVGRLQSNKARRAVRAFSTIHSVDTLDLLRRLDKVAADEAAADEGRSLRLLLQVNLSGEEAKAGFDGAWFADQAHRPGELAAALRGLHAARVAGLMTMARFAAPPDEARATFRRLRELRDALRNQSGLELPELSMGMTADAVEAAAEGATLVRIGTALFGPRPG
ncbi:MAG: YggS family pyridoxal phosphate-dependent enzyme [Candidatus Limnocylindria bacterium]